MRALLSAVIILVAGQAHAFDAETAIEQYRNAANACTVGEAEFAEEACSEQEELASALKGNGYCLAGVNWARCE